MSFLFFLLALTLLLMVSGLWIMNRAHAHLNLNRLKIFIAIAAGFVGAVTFLEVIPEQVLSFENGPRPFFIWVLVGMALVMIFERYLVPRLKFIDQFFHSSHDHFKKVESHEHHHHNLDEADHCEHSHEHGHLHAHTHPEFMGQGEVCSAIACFMVCSFFDGVALASLQGVDSKIGILMMIGVLLHLLPEGLLSGAMALAGGASLNAAKKVILFIGGAFLLGAFMPQFIPFDRNVWLAISCGILIFVTLVQLLPTALKLHYAPAWILAGVGLFMLTHYSVDLIFGTHGH